MSFTAVFKRAVTWKKETTTVPTLTLMILFLFIIPSLHSSSLVLVAPAGCLFSLPLEFYLYCSSAIPHSCSPPTKLSINEMHHYNKSFLMNKLQIRNCRHHYMIVCTLT